MRYPGGKGRTYPQLLNLMPPHSTYVETHLGGGAVMRRKRPAPRQIGIEIDPKVINRWKAEASIPFELVCCDAVGWLEANILEETALIYADPPYVSSARSRARVYRYDYSDDDHVHLIECLKKKKCMVMLSGYENTLYSKLLTDWNKVDFQAKTHTCLRLETVWFNFEPPARLHDVSHLGTGFRERETIRRRHARLKERISRLSAPEQYGLLEWLQVHLKGNPESVSLKPNPT